MKIEWLLTNVTAAGSHTRAENDICWAISDIFWSVRAAFLVEEPLCDLEISLWALKIYLGPFNEENGVVNCQCNSCRVPYQSRKCFLSGFQHFWDNSGCFCGTGVTVRSWNYPRALNILLKIIQWKKSSWLLMQQPPVPLLEQKVVFIWQFWTLFGQSRLLLWSGSHLCDMHTPLSPKNCNWDHPIRIEWFVDYQCNRCKVPCQSKKWLFFGDFGRFLPNSVHFCGRRSHFVIWKSHNEP